jgi:DNA-binding CsgD family transcriptional regulator
VSVRELEVLRLIALRASNQAMARARDLRCL